MQRTLGGGEVPGWKKMCRCREGDLCGFVELGGKKKKKGGGGGEKKKKGGGGGEKKKKKGKGGGGKGGERERTRERKENTLLFVPARCQCCVSFAAHSVCFALIHS